MQTQLPADRLARPNGQVADEVLRRCVHCGFCNATCPTYQLSGDELDGPRGRIYLIKQLLETGNDGATARHHLDRCLTCRNCESTCPSGVEYGRLLDLGRQVLEDERPRGWAERMLRAALLRFLLAPRLFAFALALCRWVRPALPRILREKIPAYRSAGPVPASVHARRYVLLSGCVQPALLPRINAASCRVLDAVGITAIEVPAARCCGALRLHLGAHAAALDDIRCSIDAWWPQVEQGVEGFVMNASGCGVTVREWGTLLRDDPQYRDKAARISAMTRDLSEVLAAELPTLQGRLQRPLPTRIAYHPPCSLQHGQRLRGGVETILRGLGSEVALPADSHLCCGSAGTYALLQPALSQALRARKRAALDQLDAPAAASANVGCITHLLVEGGVPMRHWIEWIDDALAGGR